MHSNDTIQRFIFDDYDIRGEIISINQSLRDCLSHYDFPAIINQQIGEFMAAAGLLSGTLKFDGVISLQASGNGPVKMIMADCTRHHNLRAIARLDEAATGPIIAPEARSLSDILGDGTLAITLTPARGKRYQGLVSLDSQTLSKALESYFQQSEQLATRLWIACDGRSATALLLQQLPSTALSESDNTQAWEHVTTLGETITEDELLNLSHRDILHRLFHQENVRLFDAKPVQFNCSCSRQRIADALISLGEQEVSSVIEERGTVAIQCQFCGEKYEFNKTEAETLFQTQPPTLH
ncbi:MAG: Hsp33 family molecular chaperone HslO [bacterium]